MQTHREQRAPDGIGGSGFGAGGNVFKPGTQTSQGGVVNGGPPGTNGGSGGTIGGGGGGLSGNSGTGLPPLHQDGPEAKPKITAFEQKGGLGKTEDSWRRKTNKTGSGATHVKTFHAKLTGESLEFLDKQINDWMDAHPDHEVKFSTSTVGEWTGKLREPNVIIQVWV